MGGAASVEAGALHQHVDGGVGNLGLHAAHDARERDRGGAGLAGGDETHARGERAFHVVEGAEDLALTRRAHGHGALAGLLLERVEVEGVQRLAGEHHHVVGDVHDVVVRADAAGIEALDEPLGRGPDLHVAHHAGDIAIAQALVDELDRDGLGGRGAGLSGDGRQVDVEVAVVNGADLARDADHGEAVGAVRGDLTVEHGVGRAQVLGKRHADGSILGKDHDTLVIGGEAEFARGAIHATGHDATKLALLDLDVAGQLRADHRGHDVVALVEVLCAAHDLQGLRVALGVHVVGAHVDHGDPQVIGIGMGLLGKDLGRHDAVEGLAHRLDGLDLGAGADELTGKLGGVLRQLDHALQPVVRNFHLKPLLYAPQFRDCPQIEVKPLLRTDSGNACRR